MLYNIPMYIREFNTLNKKTGTLYSTHKLVESYQTDKGPRQRIIMDLGKIDIPKNLWKSLANILESKLSGQEALIKDEGLETVAEDQIRKHNLLQKDRLQQQVKEENRDYHNVDLNSIQVVSSRSLGPELVGVHFWKKLNFSPILKTCGFTDKQIALAQAVILGRLIEPASELSTINWYQDRTSLPEFLEVDLTESDRSRMGKNRFYEIGDILFNSKDKIEATLRDTRKALFNEDSALFLYDLTNFYFEGQELGNSLAKFGRSKEKRSDCRLVTLALAVDEEGFPIFSKIFEGNQSEPVTLRNILEQAQGEGFVIDKKFTLVMDRGIATEENIDLIKEKGYFYIVIERKNRAKEYLDDFKNYKTDFEEISSTDNEEINDLEKVFIKKLELEGIARVLAVSEARKIKEAGIDEKREKRMLEDIGRLIKSNKKGNIKSIEKIHEKIGRLKEKYSPIAHLYDFEVIKDANNIVTGIECRKKSQREEKDELTGCYVIETNHQHFTGKEIWDFYMRLNQVEMAFKSLKSELGTRPIYHQTAERTKAHLFISVLAYYLLVSIEYTLKSADVHRTWSAIRKVLSTHQHTTISFEDDKKQLYHIALSGTAELGHQAIYNALDVKNPLKRKKYLMSRRL